MFMKLLNLLLLFSYICLISPLEDISLVDTKTAEQAFFSDKIINPHNFSFIRNTGNRVCNNDTFLLVYVHTAPSNFKKRLVIRETWSQRLIFKNMRLIFVLGKTNNNDDDDKIKQLLNYEYETYNDLVQGDFIDAYKNLTYKALTAFKWITMYCNHVKYILKTDDDIFVNTFIYMKHLQNLDQRNYIKPRTIMCLFWDGMKVLRDKGNKWYVSYQEYNAEYFGSYCSGSAYLFTSDLIKDMYNASYYVKFFWIDDYYITGLLARKVNAVYQPINSLYLIVGFSNIDQFKNKRNDFKLFGHFFNLNDIYLIWNYLVSNDYIERFVTSSKFNYDLHKEFRWHIGTS